jgi:hypothetical protein
MSGTSEKPEVKEPVGVAGSDLDGEHLDHVVW